MSPKLSHSIITFLENRIPGAQIATKLNISPASILSICKIHLPHLSKSQGGRPHKLKPSNVNYAVHLITTGKAKTASEITPTLSNVIKQSLHPKTVCWAIETHSLQPVKVTKFPYLSYKHRKARLEWAEKHQYYTVEDFKHVVWSDETKINQLQSDGMKWAWKNQGEELSDWLVEGTLKFGGGNLMM